MSGGDETVDRLRAGIDEVDARLQQLAARRRQLSNQIQSLRVRGGGVRYDADREQRVVDAYVAVLGPDGADFAEAVLRLCRGPVGPGRSSRPRRSSGPSS
jgi:chorismate mutase